MNIRLPDLTNYKKDFQLNGVVLPLPTIPFKQNGLLEELPTIKNNTGWPWTTQTNPGLYDINTKWPKVTIVTPSYNQGLFLEETIRSVLLQNYPNLEYIVIDGGSTDDSLDIIKKYAPWISYYYSGKDKGQSHAINKGFSLASGEYYAWLNSDDIFLSETIFKVLTRFLKTKASFVYGYALDYITETNEFGKATKIPPVLDYFMRIPSLAQPSCFWSSKINQPIWEELHCALDYELWLRILKGNKRSLIKEPLSVAKIHADAKTSDPKMKQRWHADHLLICSEDAHGPVLDWDRRVFLNQWRLKLYKWLSLG